MASTEMGKSKTEDIISRTAILEQDDAEGTIPIDAIPIQSRQRCYQTANHVDLLASQFQVYQSWKKQSTKK